MKYLTKFKILEDYNEEISNNGLSVLPNVSYVENETNCNKVKFCAKPYRTAKFIPSDTQPYVLLFKYWRNLGNVWVDGVKLDELKEYKFTITKDDVTYTEDGWFELNSQKTQKLPHVRSYEILLENEQIKDDDELYLLVNAAYGSSMLEHIGTINDCIMQGIVSYGTKKQSLLINADIFQFGFFGGVGGFILRNGEIVNTVNKLIHGTKDELDGIRITNDNWMDIQTPNISGVDTIRLVVDNIDDINDKTYVIGINSGQYFILTPLINVGSYYNNGQLTLPLGAGSLDGLLAFAELDENENVVKVLNSTCYFSIGYQDDIHFDNVMVKYNGQSEINVTFETLNRFVTPLFEGSELSELGKDALKYVTSIGYADFHDCRSLTSVTIPDSVTSIGNSAFSNCHSLSSVHLGNGVTSIDILAFAYCKCLDSITIPNSVTSIDDSAFRDCMFQPDKLVNNSSVSGYPWGAVLYDIIQEDGLCINGTTAVECRTNATTVTIPSSVTSIGNSVFWDCDILTSITIPDSVTSIGSDAFTGCDSLTSITIPDSVTSIGNRAFHSCTTLTDVVIPDSVTNIGYYVFDNTPFYDNLPDGEVYLGKCYYAYKGTMPSNTSIVITDGTKGIGNRAFYSCSGLTEVVIPDSVTNIGDEAFYSCSGLISIEIPDSVTSIGEGAFVYCNSLSSITIPNSVTSIGERAFYSCSSLRSVTLGNGLTSIGNYAFSICTKLSSITIPDSVISIGEGAFRSCSSLRSVTCLATTAPTLSYNAFSNLIPSGTLYVPNGSDYSSWLSELPSSWKIEYV